MPGTHALVDFGDHCLSQDEPRARSVSSQSFLFVVDQMSFFHKFLGLRGRWLQPSIINVEDFLYSIHGAAPRPIDRQTDTEAA